MSDQTDVFAELPVRVRVATVLCAMQRVIPILEDGTGTAEQVRTAIELGWQWEMGERVSGHTLYEPLDTLNVRLCDVYADAGTEGSSELFALTAVVYGLYYVSWNAVSAETVKLGMRHFQTYPNDLADVTDDHMLKCLEFAAKALGDIGAESERQRCLALKFAARMKDSDDRLGPVIRQEEC